MEGSRAKLAAGLAGAGAALAAAVVLLHFHVSPVPTWFYVFAWYPTLIILDLLIVWHGGPSLFGRPGMLLPMLWWSAVIWFLFEAINFRLQDWYYVFLPERRGERWLGITVSLATVVPAILLPQRLLERLGAWRTLSTPLLGAGLATGVLWEAFNAQARAKWIYTVPFLEGLKVFEMPVVGFLGFPFFALEVWSLYHVLAARTRTVPVLASALFAVLVLV